MSNFEYGDYSIKYNEFQHKLEVRCDDHVIIKMNKVRGDDYYDIV